MNEPKTRGRPAKPARTLDDEIAETEARLQALREKQLEEKARREREANSVQILALLRDEGLDAATLDQWRAVLPGLRELLKIEAPAAAPAKAAETAPVAAAELAQDPA
ncbi:MAG TPA: hypothetical protein VFL86_07065 [Burkholderiaceae bacterium]|nr:hypothetical protein [Burkholderiaceae bacterium]